MTSKQNDLQSDQHLPSSVDASSSPSTKHHHDGNPPWHAIAFIVGCIAIFVQQLLASPSNTSGSSVFSHVLFPNILPLSVVVSIRLLFALIIFADVFRATSLVVYLDHRSEYYPGSQLKAGAPILYRGILTEDGTFWSGFLGVASFTMVTWILEGIFFFIAGILPLLGGGEQDSRVIAALSSFALVLWEIATPCAFLLTLIVTFVLWPFAIEAEKQGKTGQVGLLNRMGPLLAHNLNVLAITMELSLLGGFPIRWDHFAMAPLYGCIYVLFSWAMKNCWLPQLSREERQAWGPQFIYPFMDTTLGWNTTFSLLALLMVLMLSHCGVYGLHQLLYFYSPHLYDQEDHIKDNGVAEDDSPIRFVVHCSAMFIIGFCICRFR